MAMNLPALACDMAADFRSKVQSGDSRTMTVMLVALICAVAPFDITQLVLVLVGAGAYALLQPVSVQPSRRAHKGTPPRPLAPQADAAGRYLPPAMRGGGAAVAASRFPPRVAPKPARPEPCLQPSVQPVVAPTFEAEGFDAQVEELVASLMPTAASNEAVVRLAERVKSALRSSLPEAEVMGFATSSALRSRAFGVAVPEVEVVVKCSPGLVAARFDGRGGSRPDMHRIYKVVLRAFTDRLMTTGCFKFRRSAFAAGEPKVTLLASDSAVSADAVPLDLYMNATAPLRNAALIAECGRLDARASALILLVRRWARDRGICHAAKGNLPPYCWTLLAIYFLQVGGEQVLPALDGFVSNLAAGAAATPRGGEAAEGQTVGSLFRGFVAFYNSRFSVKDEAVSVRLGQRAPPAARLRPKTEAAPAIEDPFDESNNLAATMTAEGYARFREEFGRASSMLEDGKEAALSDLLTPWAPEEAGAAE